MQGSGVWAGAHDIEAERAKTDDDGVTLGEALDDIGYLGDVPVEPGTEYDAYLELHVEQGPKLDEADADVGVVAGIVEFTWGFHGEANHSGPTPMHHRSDALVAAGDLITAIRRIPGTLGEQTVGTVGYIHAEPDSINVIPGEVTVTWRFRDPDDRSSNGRTSGCSRRPSTQPRGRESTTRPKSACARRLFPSRIALSTPFVRQPTLVTPDISTGQRRGTRCDAPRIGMRYWHGIRSQ